MTTTRLYLSDAVTPQTPAAIYGTYTEQAGSGNLKGGGAKAGAATTFSVVKAAVGGTWTVLLARWAFPAFTQSYALTAADTVELMSGIGISSVTSAVVTLYATLFVMQADGTLRGVALQDSIGSDVIVVTAAGVGDGAIALGATVNVSPGDYLVLELGARKTGTATGTRTFTVHYGGTGGTDLTNGSTNVTTEPGWLELVTASDPWAVAGGARRVMLIS